MNPYRERVWCEIETLLGDRKFESALDFGAGDGWFAQQMLQSGRVAALRAVDVQERPEALTPVEMFDGRNLPFEDQSFDLVYAIDVLHHCPRPKEQLREALRVCKTAFLLKDHSYSTPLGKLTLCALDEVGNRKFGVPSLYHYQRGWEWSRTLEEAGFRRSARLHPAPVHVGAMGRATNSLQFLALWERR